MLQIRLRIGVYAVKIVVDLIFVYRFCRRRNTTMWGVVRRVFWVVPSGTRFRRTERWIRRWEDASDTGQQV